jgi:hypothetical protein
MPLSYESSGNDWLFKGTFERSQAQASPRTNSLY